MPVKRGREYRSGTEDCIDVQEMRDVNMNKFVAEVEAVVSRDVCGADVCIRLYRRYRAHEPFSEQRSRWYQ